MSKLRGAPPGRAGRSWLLHRLETAERGIELLDRKLQILRGEQRRYQLASEQTRAAWYQQCRNADSWLLRAALLGGEHATRLAVSGDLADVRISWATAMGVRYPASGDYAFTDRFVTATVATNAAVLEASRACREALDAAVRHAVTDAALRTVTVEIAATGRRRRAIDDRWIPALSAALHETELTLEELERADAVRLRWAARRHEREAAQEQDQR